MPDDPFALLGLPAQAGLTDDDVHAAWRRIAAATHPDREDGGDPARFGAAAAAYMLLRTSFGRGEALADLGAPGRPHRGGRHARGAHRNSTHRNSARRSRAHRTSTHRSRARRSSARRSTGRRTRGGPGPGWPAPGLLVTGRLVTGATGAGRLGPGLLRAVRRGIAWLGGEAGARPAALTLPVASAAAVASGTVVAAGLTPATIGLLTGALTVTGWALWRQGGPGQ